MTLVIDRGTDGPRVHVLAIGVGAYRHLPGGSDPVEHDVLGLQQLSGPTSSVRLFLDWATTTMHHPRAPLGTVELLTSPQQAPDGANDPAANEDPNPELPTMDAVTGAFERWYARCDTDEDNVALFYFCGHGVQRESEYLLLEDFGRSPHWLLENAVDIGTTYEAMASCRAKEQYFFIDACREIPFQLLRVLNGQARSLATLSASGDTRRDAALLFATSGGSKAYGKPGKATRFTQALVRGLEGLGSHPGTSGWVVDINTLQRAITVQLGQPQDRAPFQQPTIRGSGQGVLHTFTQPPKVPVTIPCTPPSAVATTRVNLQPRVCCTDW